MRGHKNKINCLRVLDKRTEEHDSLLAVLRQENIRTWFLACGFKDMRT